MVFLLSISKAPVGVMWNFKPCGNLKRQCSNLHLSPEEVSCWGVYASAH